MSNYFIELAAIHVALFVGYWFFLRKERQYTKMRFYLLASTLLALTVPLLKLPKLFFGNRESSEAVPLTGFTMEAIPIASAAETSSWDTGIVLWLYLTVSAFFLFKVFSGIIYLVRLERRSVRARFKDMCIRKVGDIKGSFTFFNWIFLSKDIDPDQHDYEVILKHERAHASLGHTYDLLFFQLFKAFFWWLPTAWIIIREIKKIHEYQADAAALKSCDVDQYSSILISSTLKTNGVNLTATRRQAVLASSFYDGLILKRLIAMKLQVKKISPWKFAALSALCLSLIVVFACSEEKPVDAGSAQAPEGKIFTIVEAQPEFEGGINGFRSFVMKEIRYPLEARQAGIEGQVDVEFVVDKDGSVSDVKAIKGIGKGCDEEAVRVLQNSPRFKPATQNGKPVRVRMAVPITFKLNEGKTNPDNSTQGIVVIEEVQSRNEHFKVDADYNGGEWSGTVYDEEGNGLPGVNILAIGTTTGTVSGSDGKFRLKVDGSNDLSFSFIGYETVKLSKK